MGDFLQIPQSKFSSELSRTLQSSDGVVYLSDNVIENRGFLVIAPGTSNEEIIEYQSSFSGGVSVCTRNLSTVGSSRTGGTGKLHGIGTPVEMRNVHHYFARAMQALNGISTISANSFYIGENMGTVSSIVSGSGGYGVFYRGGTSASDEMFGVGLSSNGYAVWTEDAGATWNRLSATGGAIATGDGWENVGGVGNAVVSDLISATAGISSINDNFSVNEAWDPTWTGDHDFQGNVSVTGAFFGINATTWGISGTRISATGDEFNQMVNGVSAYSDVTPYNLSILVDGFDSQASAFHKHYSDSVASEDYGLPVAVSSVCLVHAASDRYASGTEWLKLKEIQTQRAGTVLGMFTLWPSGGSRNVSAQVYINGVSAGIVAGVSANTILTSTLSIAVNDLIQVCAIGASAGAPSAEAGVRDFGLYAKNSSEYTINTD